MIASRYEILGEIGSGGMGTVFKGNDTSTNQTVAIKRLDSAVLKRDPGLLERFRREGEALRELNHPNIVKMLDAVDDENIHYLIMEYVTGGDLTSLLSEDSLPIHRILNIALDLSDALTRAHRLQIIHRDLKPANVLLTADKIPLLTDFGVAHIGTKDRVTATESIVGTIDYLSPEALSGKEIDTRTDIWAFGVMLYEMVTGERPFPGDSMGEVVTKILQAPVPDIEDIRPDAPIALVDLIYRMLDKDPQTRIASVRLIGAEIEALLQGRDTRTDALVSVNQSRFVTPTPAMVQVQNHNLPAQTTPFVGREAELSELSRLMDDPKIRLITIIAPGGMGKTRLSLEAAERQLGEFADGVFFVPLAPISQAENILPAIAESIGYQYQNDGRSEKQQVLDYLNAKNVLLVIDNWEHVIEGADIVTEILNAASAVQILATSRQRLGQQGESLFHLAGMDFPNWETPEDAHEFAAVKLFLNSARRVQPDFELSSDNLSHVARICRLAQGMPLGIVLAAAWLAMLSPDEIAVEIENGIEILEDEAGEFPERQKSIRAVFDYSWKQLTEDEQVIFTKMSLFRGGFTREAVQEITGAGLRQLMAMINKSLIWRDSQTGRYQIHELLRQYASEKLKNSAHAQTTQDQHAQYYLRFLAKQCKSLKSSGQIASLDTIEPDYENIKVAWQYALENNSYEAIDQALEALELFCVMRSRIRDGQVLFQQARDALGTLQSENTLAHRLQIRFPKTETSIDSIRNNLMAALEYARKENNIHEVAYCVVKLGEIAHNVEKNPQQAIQYFEEGSSLYREIGETYYLGDALSRLGESHQMLGDFEKTGALVQESYQLQTQSGDELGASKTLRALGMFSFMGGDFVESTTFTRQGYQIHQRSGNLAGQAEGLLFVGWMTLFTGNREEGRDQLTQSMKIARDIGLHSTHAWSLALLSISYSASNDLQKARELLTEAQSIQTNPFQQTGAGDVWLQACITWAKCTLHLAEGDRSTTKQNLKEILTLAHQTFSYGFLVSFMPLVVIVYAQEDQMERAAELLGILDSGQEESVQWLKDWDLFMRTRDEIKQHLGEDQFQSAWKQGKSIDIVAAAKRVLDELWPE